MSTNNTTLPFHVTYTTADFDWDNVTNTTTEFDWEPFFYASSPYRELQLLYLGVSLLLAVGGNAVVLLTVLLTEDLRTPGNVLLCALAATDILQAILKIPLAMYALATREFLSCTSFVLTISTMYMFFATFSVSVIAPISLDRYWYICWPLKYPDIMTTTRTALLTGGFTLLPLAAVLPPLMEGGRDSFFPTLWICRYEGPARLIRQSLMNVCFAVTLATMFFCYYKIWREVRRHQATISQLQPAPLSDRTQGTTSDGQTQDTPETDLPGDESTPSEQVEGRVGPCNAQVNLVFKSDDEGRDLKVPSVQDDREHNDVTRPSVQPAAIEERPGRHLLSQEFRQRVRTAGTVMMVIVVFWATWIPLSVVIFRVSILGAEVSAATDGVWQRITVLVSLVSTFSNPIIYAYRNRELRRAFFRLFPR